jgi:hypothetical protein
MDSQLRTSDESVIAVNPTPIARSMTMRTTSGMLSVSMPRRGRRSVLVPREVREVFVLLLVMMTVMIIRGGVEEARSLTPPRSAH